MYQFFGFLVTYAVGFAGYLLFKKLRIPTPALLGAIFATAAMNIAGFYPSFPLWPVSYAANVAIGIIIGRQIDRNTLSKMKELLPYVFGFAVGLIALSLFCGGIFYKLTDVSLKTALIASTAGGITEMMIFGMSIEADLAVIACVQLFRIIAALVVIPYIVRFAAHRITPLGQDSQTSGRLIFERFTRIDYIFLVLCAATGAALGLYLNIPAGGMLGAMLASGAYAIFISKQYSYDIRLRYIAQIGLGLVMGQRMTYEMVAQLRWVLLPTIATTAVMLAGCVALAFLLHKLSGWDILTCLLCTSPAGLSQIAIYAEEVGADAFTASIFHTVRILSIVITFPWIVLWLTL